MKKIFALTILVCAFSALTFAQQKENAVDKLVFDGVQVEDNQSYLVLSTKRIQTMEKELDKAAANGFRIVYGAPAEGVDMALLLENVRLKGEGNYSYKILATSRPKTMEKELNEMAAQGYRLLPRTITFKMGFITGELLMIMEHAPASDKKYDYKLAIGEKETKLHKKMDAFIAQGYSPVTMITGGVHIVVMEK